MRMISRVSFHSLLLIVNSIQGLFEDSITIKVSQNALWLNVVCFSSSLGCLSVTAVDRGWSKWDFWKTLTLSLPCCSHHLPHQSSEFLPVNSGNSASNRIGFLPYFVVCACERWLFNLTALIVVNGRITDVTLDIHMHCELQN